MRKDVLTHFTFAIALFIIITVIKNWFDIMYVTFWIGGVIGTLLPDIDYLINVYVLNPDREESKVTADMVSQKRVAGVWERVAQARKGKTELLFHTIIFQLIFWVFAVYVLSSTGSLLAKGIVLAFALHLIIDQLTDLMETGSLSLWFAKAPFALDEHKQKIYLLLNILLIFVLVIFI